jgi:hypothetical protein
MTRLRETKTSVRERETSLVVVIGTKLPLIVRILRLQEHLYI